MARRKRRNAKLMNMVFLVSSSTCVHFVRFTGLVGWHVALLVRDGPANLSGTAAHIMRPAHAHTTNHQHRHDAPSILRPPIRAPIIHPTITSTTTIATATTNQPSITPGSAPATSWSCAAAAPASWGRGAGRGKRPPPPPPSRPCCAGATAAAGSCRRCMPRPCRGRGVAGTAAEVRAPCV